MIGFHFLSHFLEFSSLDTEGIGPNASKSKAWYLMTINKNEFHPAEKRNSFPQFFSRFLAPPFDGLSWPLPASPPRVSVLNSKSNFVPTLEEERRLSYMGLAVFT